VGLRFFSFFFYLVICSRSPVNKDVCYRTSCLSLSSLFFFSASLFSSVAKRNSLFFNPMNPPYGSVAGSNPPPTSLITSVPPLPQNYSRILSLLIRAISSTLTVPLFLHRIPNFNLISPPRKIAQSVQTVLFGLRHLLSLLISLLTRDMSVFHQHPGYAVPRPLAATNGPPPPASEFPPFALPLSFLLISRVPPEFLLSFALGFFELFLFPHQAILCSPPLALPRFCSRKVVFFRNTTFPHFFHVSSCKSVSPL